MLPILSRRASVVNQSYVCASCLCNVVVPHSNNALSPRSAAPSFSTSASTSIRLGRPEKITSKSARKKARMPSATLMSLRQSLKALGDEMAGDEVEAEESGPLASAAEPSASEESQETGSRLGKKERARKRKADAEKAKAESEESQDKVDAKDAETKLEDGKAKDEVEEQRRKSVQRIQTRKEKRILAKQLEAKAQAQKNIPELAGISTTKASIGKKAENSSTQVGEGKTPVISRSIDLSRKDNGPETNSNATAQDGTNNVWGSLLQKGKTSGKMNSPTISKESLIKLIQKGGLSKAERISLVKQLRQALLSKPLSKSNPHPKEKTKEKSTEEKIELSDMMETTLETKGLGRRARASQKASKDEAKAKVKAKANAKVKATAHRPVKVRSVKSQEEPLGKVRAVKGKSEKIGSIKIETVAANELELTPLNEGPLVVPSLSYGLDRVLFNPGVYQLQDPRSRVFNFDPYLQEIMPIEEFDFTALKEYITSSRDEALLSRARSEKLKYTGSTSSMTSALAHFHFLLSQWRKIKFDNLSKSFPATYETFTNLSRAPVAVFLRYRDGVYAIDADKQYDTANILMSLGKSMEKLLTLPTSDFEKYKKENSDQITEEQRNDPEEFHYSKLGDFLLRSQLDAYDSRLPGTGMFDLKTRAVVSIRMDMSQWEEGKGYQIRGRHGEWESFEREYYDMIRSAFLKYSLQVRMGRMDGIFVAFHNIERIFGFQYISLGEMDYALHGTENTTLGDSEFKFSVKLLNSVLDKAIKRFPEKSLRLHFETRDTKIPFMYIFAEPVEEDEIVKIQTTNQKVIEEFEERVLGIQPKKQTEDQKTAEWNALQASIQETLEQDEIDEEKVETLVEVEDADSLDPQESKTLTDEDLAVMDEDEETSHELDKIFDFEHQKNISDKASTTEALAEVDSDHQGNNPEVADQIEGVSVAEDLDADTSASEPLEDILEESANEVDPAEELEEEAAYEHESEILEESDNKVNPVEDSEVEPIQENEQEILDDSDNKVDPVEEAEEEPGQETEQEISEDSEDSKISQQDVITEPVESQTSISTDPEVATMELENDASEHPEEEFVAEAEDADNSEVATMEPESDALENADKVATLESENIIIEVDSSPFESEEADSNKKTFSLEDALGWPLTKEGIEASETGTPRTQPEATPLYPDSEKEILGMTLAIRNKVDGQYVDRPENLTEENKWDVEYALAEIEDDNDRVHNLYRMLVMRRYRAMNNNHDAKGENKINDDFMAALKMYIAKGREWKEKQRLLDANKPVKVVDPVVLKSGKTMEEIKEEEDK